MTQEEVLKSLSAEKLAQLRSAVAFQVSGRSFEGFLDNVKIVEPPQFASGFQGGPVDFQKWEHLIDLAKIMPETRLVAVLKARQDGFSWLVAAYTAYLHDRCETESLGRPEEVCIVVPLDTGRCIPWLNERGVTARI